MAKNKVAVGFIILLIIAFASWGLYYILFSGNWNYETCVDECVHRGYNNGKCVWSIESEEDDKNIGSCLIKNSKHCGNDGQCNCYCYTEQKVGGCGAVHPKYIQECCNRWAVENKIIKPACVGNWEIAEGECSWICAVGEKLECLGEGGKWIELDKIYNHEISLGIKTTKNCLKYGGSCDKERIISSTTIGECDNSNECWIGDFWKDTCLMPKS